MRVITVNVSDIALQGLEALVAGGIYASRSEAVRAAIQELLERKVEHLSRVNEVVDLAEMDLRTLLPKLRKGARIEWKLST